MLKALMRFAAGIALAGMLTGGAFAETVYNRGNSS